MATVLRSLHHYKLLFFTKQKGYGQRETDVQNIGSQLGANGVNRMIAQVEQHCAHKTQRITLETVRRPLIALRAELSLLAKRAALRNALRNAPRAG
jgi:hypothetical protein